MAIVVLKALAAAIADGDRVLGVIRASGIIYDPEEGDPDGGIPPGTPFGEIPDSWFCPVCGARKADFEPYEE